jgi:hypothetical protein
VGGGGGGGVIVVVGVVVGLVVMEVDGVLGERAESVVPALADCDSVEVEQINCGGPLGATSARRGGSFTVTSTQATTPPKTTNNAPPTRAVITLSYVPDI